MLATRERKCYRVEYEVSSVFQAFGWILYVPERSLPMHKSFHYNHLGGFQRMSNTAGTHVFLDHRKTELRRVSVEKNGCITSLFIEKAGNVQFWLIRSTDYRRNDFLRSLDCFETIFAIHCSNYYEIDLVALQFPDLRSFSCYFHTAVTKGNATVTNRECMSRSTFSLWWKSFWAR